MHIECVAHIEGNAYIENPVRELYRHLRFVAADLAIALAAGCSIHKVRSL